MKLRYIKIRKWISLKWLTADYWLSGATWQEADHVARSVVYGCNWGKDD